MEEYFPSLLRIVTKEIPSQASHLHGRLKFVAYSVACRTWHVKCMYNHNRPLPTQVYFDYRSSCRILLFPLKSEVLSQVICHFFHVRKNRISFFVVFIEDYIYWSVLNNSVSDSVQCISVKCCMLDSDLLDLVQLVVYTQRAQRLRHWNGERLERWTLKFSLTDGRLYS